MAAAEFDDRNGYMGEKYKELREGYGVYVYENKFFRYEGEWRNGKKRGQGKLCMSDGSYYEGEFENGEITGHGFRYFAASGNVYSGEFEMGEQHGQGVMRHPDGSMYEGEWHRNKKQGFGVERGPDGAVLYHGNFYNHRRNGEGIQNYSNGDRYEGDWVLGKRQGHGVITYADGSVYDGQWLNDLRSGEGTLRHQSGLLYEGIWMSDKPAEITSRMEMRVKPADLRPGERFIIEVECLTDEGIAFHESSRMIQLIAAVRSSNSAKTPQPSNANEKSSDSLFQVIEDFEDAPIATPFGYEVVRCHLFDMSDVKDLDNVEESTTVETEVQDGQLDNSGETTATEQRSIVHEPPLVVSKTNFGRVVFGNLQLQPASRLTGKESESDRVHGEYVLIAQDITNPPFMDRTLDQVYILVRFSAEEKTKRKKPNSSAEKKESPSAQN